MTSSPVEKKIIKRARHLFATKGYQATTTRQIIAGIGTDSLLYYYFPQGKGQLLETIVKAAPLPVIPPVVITPATAVTTAAVIDQVLAYCANLWQQLRVAQTRETFLILIREQPALPLALTGYLAEMQAHYRDALLTGLRLLAGFDRRPQKERETLVQVIMGLYQNYVFSEYLVKNQHAPVDQLIATLKPGVTLLLRDSQLI